MDIINDVVVDNGILKHQVQYVYSPNNIKVVVNNIVFRLGKELINEINSKNIQLLIKTNSDYTLIEYSELITDDYDLKHRFNQKNPRA
tara:strand:- start:1117 stop:1380 length:264 start_codon:yes stop_codon:yes gene_type:complete